MNNEATGKVVQVQSSVVDVQFPAGEIADLYEGLIVSMPGKDDLVLEVENNLPARLYAVWQWIRPTGCSEIPLC